MTDLFGLLTTEVDALVQELGQPRFRANQLLQALYRHGATDLSSIAVLPAAFRTALVEGGYTAGAATCIHTATSDDGDTTKLLLRMADGILIETVLMQYPEPGSARHPRSTVCVSTQSGCAMGCTFCATGQMGFERNLTAAEVVAQVMHIAALLRQRGQHVTNIVFMGMGEPLANYGQTIRAIRILTDPRAFGIAQRSITVSTVGVLRGIERLAAEDLQVGLAISLHAADDQLRQRLVPTAGPHSVRDLVEAARTFFASTGRRVTFEYALIAGVNDAPEQAEALGRLIGGMGVHVNLIPVNPTAGGFEKPSRPRVVAFEGILRDRGVNCTVRAEKGSEIAAACGQLRTDIEAAATLRSAGPSPVHGRRQAGRGPAPSPGR